MISSMFVTIFTDCLWLSLQSHHSVTSWGEDIWSFEQIGCRTILLRYTGTSPCASLTLYWMQKAQVLIKTKRVPIKYSVHWSLLLNMLNRISQGKHKLQQICAEEMRHTCLFCAEYCETDYHQLMWADSWFYVTKTQIFFFPFLKKTNQNNNFIVVWM